MEEQIQICEAHWPMMKIKLFFSLSMKLSKAAVISIWKKPKFPRAQMEEGRRCRCCFIVRFTEEGHLINPLNFKLECTTLVTSQYSKTYNEVPQGLHLVDIGKLINGALGRANRYVHYLLRQPSDFVPVCWCSCLFFVLVSGKIISKK